MGERLGEAQVVVDGVPLRLEELDGVGEQRNLQADLEEDTDKG
jgi:hypothetical protein